MLRGPLNSLTYASLTPFARRGSVKRAPVLSVTQTLGKELVVTSLLREGTWQLEEETGGAVSPMYQFVSI
jgi:hypothetical protein